MALSLCLLLPASVPAAGKIFEVRYPASEVKGELQFGVKYIVWIPDGVKQLRGVIVHQHGCGTGACQGGATAAYDLHWQALAAKHDCALLGPSYEQEDKQNCRLWCDPRNGSAKTFLKSLDDLGAKSKHPELAEVPWCLWGHSGGAFWASIMQTLYPERCVAIWFRSGTAYASWEKGEIEKVTLNEAVYGVPMMLNPGLKEKDDKRFGGLWRASEAMFKAYRAKDAPIGFAADPRTSHECGDSRYLAIPFFDACLKMRLPDKPGKEAKLKVIDVSKGQFAELFGKKTLAASEFKGDKAEAVWLPNAEVAKAYQEYIEVGSVSDKTPPPAPFNIKVTTKDDGVILSWEAKADFESGLRGFIILREGKEIAQVPAKPVGRFGRALFQTMSYHDTPEAPMPKMEFVDKAGKKGEKYEVIAVNSVGLKSKETASKERE
jgi:hypothetical protein